MQNPSSKLALIKLYRSMLKHDDGIEWLKQEKAWKRAIDYCIQDETIYVVRHAKEFITDFVFRIANDDDVCLEVITVFCRPIAENAYVEQTGNITVDSCDFQRKVTPSMNLICSVLERYIQSNQKSSIVQNVLTANKGHINLWKLSDMTHDRQLYSLIIHSLIYISFGTLMDKLNSSNSTDSSTISLIDFNEFGLSFLNLCKICVLRKQFEALMNGARLYYTVWKSLENRVPEEIILGNQLTNFENQVILFQILPVVSVMHPVEKCLPELLEDYFLKLFHISSEHTLRICYSFRDAVKNANVFELANKSIQCILSMIHILHRDRAIIVFQALCHVIKRVITPSEAAGESVSLIEMPTLMTSVLSGLHSIVKTFRVTWKDSYEAVGLLNCMLYIIDDPNLTPRVGTH